MLRLIVLLALLGVIAAGWHRRRRIIEERRRRRLPERETFEPPMPGRHRETAERRGWRVIENEERE